MDMQTRTLNYEIVETGPAPDSVVIWLHGLGSCGQEFARVVPDLGLPPDLPIRFIFPSAPTAPVTIHGGTAIPSWYDIKTTDPERSVDEEQLRASADAIGDLIEEQMNAGIDSRRIVLAGFSQGGAVALEAALSWPYPLAGLLLLSTYFATANSIEPHPANHQLPVHIFHGCHDPVVPDRLGRCAHKLLLSRGYPAEFRAFPIQHEVSYEELDEIAADLQVWL